jgi:membrane protease YdiL (CAAX protease family)
MTADTLKRRQLKKELFAFLIITFTATYILNFVMYAISGPISAAPPVLWTVTIAINMFIPAAAAIMCMLYFQKALTRETKIIFTFFLIYAMVFTIESYAHPIQAGSLADMPIFAMIISILGFLTLVILNLKKKWRDGLTSSKLSFGKNLRYYIILPVILFLMLTLSYVLNYYTGLGVPTKEFSPVSYFIYSIVTGILYIFILWPSFFGEEYGWRVYLQDRLFPLLGGYKGVLVLGIIWGLWHAPLIAFGFNYPGQPILGNILMILLTIVLAVIFSYAVLKTGSVWIAVLLHLVTDAIELPANYYLGISKDPILSFGIGIFGIALLAVFAIVLLRSSVWKLGEEAPVSTEKNSA